MKQLNLRLSDETHTILTEMAVADRRSLNAMLIVLIEQEKQRRDKEV